MVKAAAINNYHDAFRLDEALALANGGNVFPETIQVRRDRWQRACQFYYLAQASADDRRKSDLTKAEKVRVEELYDKAVLDRQMKGLVADAISCGYREPLDGEDVRSAAAQTPRWRPWAAIGLLVAGFVAGIVCGSTTAMQPTKMAMGVSWTVTMLVGWWLGELAGYQKRSLGYAAHWVSFVLSSWALHELAVPRVIPGTQFLPSLELGDGLASGILTLAGGWAIGAGLYVRTQVNDRAKKSMRTRT